MIRGLPRPASYGPGTGRGRAAGPRNPNRCWPSSATSLDRLDELGDHLGEVTDDTEVGDREDGSLRVLVDRDDVLRVLHAHHVQGRPGNPAGDVHHRLHRLAGLTNLEGVRHPARVDDGA